jgi:hypothetical protein
MAHTYTDDKVPRARPGDTGSVFTGELRPSNMKLTGVDSGDGTVVGRSWYRSKDDLWTTKEGQQLSFPHL